MAFLIGGANSAAADTAFSVDNSCRWNRADTPYMHQTFSGAGNRDKWTFSCWVKKCSNGVEQRLLTTSDNSTYDDNIRFESDDKFMIICNNTEVLKTNRVFRDNSAFYHICVIWDSGNGTSGDRVQLWVNGTRETSFGTEAYPDQNTDSHINNATPHYIGVTNATANSHHLHGYLAEVVFQNDSAASPVDKFGEFDEDSPTIFKPIDVSGLTLGTNGTYLDFEDSSNLGNDIGGGTDWTEVNFAATDQSSDSPTNSFATWNSLADYYYAGSYAEGNCQTTTGSSEYGYLPATIGVSSGLWYCEIEWDAKSGGGGAGQIGITSTQSTASNIQLGQNAHDYGWYGPDGKVYNNNDGDTITGQNTFTEGDIIGIYLDLNANKLYFAKNGTLENSGTGISITDPASTPLGAYFFAICYPSSSYTGTYKANFGGCPAFAISSGNTDANGYGNFEYDPSSGTFDSASKNF